MAEIENIHCPICTQPIPSSWQNALPPALATLEQRGDLELYRPIEIPNFDNSFFRVASVSNRLLMANRDIRQIYDKQWTVTVVDEVLKLFFYKKKIPSEMEVVPPQNCLHWLHCLLTLFILFILFKLFYTAQT